MTQKFPKNGEIQFDQLLLILPKYIEKQRQGAQKKELGKK